MFETYLYKQFSAVMTQTRTEKSKLTALKTGIGVRTQIHVWIKAYAVTFLPNAGIISNSSYFNCNTEQRFTRCTYNIFISF